MALRTNVEDVGVRIDPLSFAADISVLYGNPTQVGNGLDDGYMPSRKSLPCVLLPIVEVADPDNFISGRQKLASCYWFEGTPLPDERNMITGTTQNYEIIADAGPHQYALKVKKNFPINTSQIIHARFTFVDVRTDTAVKVERQIVFRTVEYDENMLHAQLTDCPSIMRIDPLDEPNCGDAPWLHTVTTQLFKGKEAHPDEKTTYKWQIFDERLSSYRDFTTEEKQFVVTNWDKKSLTFDARFLQKEALKCLALPKDKPEWKYPLYTNIALDVKLAETIIAEIVCIKGLRIGPRMDQEVTYRCDISYNKGMIPADKYDLFRIKWKAKDDSVGATEKVLGTGRTITFIPKDYGFNCKNFVSVYAEVELRQHSAVVVNKENKIIVNSSNKIVVTNIYK